MEQNIINIIEKIDEFVEMIYCDFNEAMKHIKVAVTLIEPYMVSFLSKIDYYNKCGEKIDKNILIHQLQNLAEGIEYKDQIEMTDTLKYEIRESLLVYNELVQIYEK